MPSYRCRVRRIAALGALGACSLAGSLAGSLGAQSAVPVQASAEVVTDSLATTGRATLRLRFTAEAALRAPYAVRVELHTGGRMILRRDHAPPTPTTRWEPE
ncbi:MAG: hypothetical protein ACON4Z_02800, partial [Planctomycetota bacterium]